MADTTRPEQQKIDPIPPIPPRTNIFDPDPSIEVGLKALQG